MAVIDAAMRDALASRSEAVALACMDTRSGLLLGLQLRGDVPRDDVEIAALSAAQLCVAPCRAGRDEADDEACDESFLSSPRWLHAYARVPSRRDLVVVGLAPGTANVALFRAWIRQVAAGVGPIA